MSNYYQPSTGKTYTETVLKTMGFPVDNPLAFKQAGIFPIEYSRPNYDVDVEELKAKDTPVLQDGVYIQGFDVVELPAEQQQANLDKVAKKKADEARDAADQATAPYLSDFSTVEKMTFEQQRLEVEAYKQNQNVATPTLDALARERGISRMEQITKAIAKVDKFAEISAVVVGKQQGYEDAIKTVKNDDSQSVRSRITAIRDMTFDFSLPNA